MNQLSTDIPEQAVSAVNSGIIEHRTIDFIQSLSATAVYLASLPYGLALIYKLLP